jgi:hypothetical protein
MSRCHNRATYQVFAQDGEKVGVVCGKHRISMLELRCTNRRLSPRGKKTRGLRVSQPK